MLVIERSLLHVLCESDHYILKEEHGVHGERIIAKVGFLSTMYLACVPHHPVNDMFLS